MSRSSRPLHWQLSGLTLLLLAAVLLCSAWIIVHQSSRYHLEVTQQLHAGLAQYILDHQYEPLRAPDGEPNQPALKQMAMHVMMINPAVEVYLLDEQGRILGHALPESSVAPGRIDLEPVLRRLDRQHAGLVMGDNPRAAERPMIFSVAALPADIGPGGYLYILLSGQQEATLAEQLAASHVLKTSLALLGLVLASSAILAFWLLRRVTRPLRQLDARAQSFASRLSGNPQAVAALARTRGNEVQSLETRFSQMQQRIQAQFDQLRESDRLRRDLVANVSHDLRTPLASMQGYLETLKLKGRQLSPEKQDQYLDIAYRHTQHLAELIRQLFELSRIDSGEISVHREAFSLLELIYDTAQDFELELSEKSVTLRIESTIEHAAVVADISLIGRVLQNLIVNAKRHTPKGGEIVIAVNACQKGIEVSVRDSGPGLSEKALDLVFERHYQEASESAGTSAAGCGLGLHIVRRILELHQSGIVASNVPGAGACFCFQLPQPLHTA